MNFIILPLILIVLNYDHPRINIYETHLKLLKSFFFSSWESEMDDIFNIYSLKYYFYFIILFPISNISWLTFNYLIKPLRGLTLYDLPPPPRIFSSHWADTELILIPKCVE